MLSCYSCQQIKSENEFYREKYRSRGYSIYCKSCTLRKERIRNGTSLDITRNPPGSFNRQEWSKSYRAANKAYYTEKSISRLRIKQAFPLTKEQKKQIVAIYKRAQDERMVVDHYHPLNHPLCCGLHVPWNLDVIPHEENAKKSNKFPEPDLLFQVTV